MSVDLPSETHRREPFIITTMPHESPESSHGFMLFSLPLVLSRKRKFKSERMPRWCLALPSRVSGLRGPLPPPGGPSRSLLVAASGHPRPQMEDLDEERLWPCCVPGDIPLLPELQFTQPWNNSYFLHLRVLMMKGKHEFFFCNLQDTKHDTQGWRWQQWW